MSDQILLRILLTDECQKWYLKDAEEAAVHFRAEIESLKSQFADPRARVEVEEWCGIDHDEDEPESFWINRVVASSQFASDFRHCEIETSPHGDCASGMLWDWLSEHESWDRARECEFDPTTAAIVTIYPDYCVQSFHVGYVCFAGSAFQSGISLHRRLRPSSAAKVSSRFSCNRQRSSPSSWVK